MQCNDVRTFMSQIAAKSVAMQISVSDLDFLSGNNYVSVMAKEDYDRASAEVANLTQMNIDQQSEMDYERGAENTLRAEEKKTHSIMFHFENEEKKKADLQALQSEKEAVSKVEAEITLRDSKIKELIQKKSTLDRMVPYDGRYLSLTGLGVTTLNDLNVRNYRFSNSEFVTFLQEQNATMEELRLIAYKANYYASNLKVQCPGADLSQLWSIAVGLGKLQGDPNQIGQRFDMALDDLDRFGSTLENKMLAAEIMASFNPSSSQSSTGDELKTLTDSLQKLDYEVRHDKVPKELSIGVAAIILYGRRYDGTFPTDRLDYFSRKTLSSESAAILAIVNAPTDLLAAKFDSYRGMFNNWGYEVTEDTELASAYLAISDFQPGEVYAKLTIIVDSLRNYLEYPLVGSAILASIPTLEANETLDLLQKAYSMLGTYTHELFQPELLSLSVRMIHGVKNELVKELDPTAKIMNTPIQFSYVPSNVFFFYYAPLIIAHSSYYSTFSAIGGYHPAHVHGVGGFMG